MAVAALKSALDTNPFLVNIEKLLSGNGNKISHAKQVIFLVTDKRTVESSKELLSDMKAMVKSLPKDDLESLAKATSYLTMLKKLQSDLNKFFSFFQPYVIDDSNAKKLVSNITECAQCVEDMIEYMSFAIETYHILQDIKTSPKISAEELKARLSLVA